MVFPHGPARASFQHGGFAAARLLVRWLCAVEESSNTHGGSCTTTDDLTSEVLPSHFLGILLVNKGGADGPRFKGRRIRLHHLMGGWQGSRRENGMRVIAASIFGKENLPQVPI